MKIVAFIAGTAALAWVSGGSLRAPRSHGFYRFLAWEALLALLLLNVERWFDDPFAAHQLLAWALLLLSAGLVLHGVQLLRTAGKPAAAAQDPATFRIESTTRLVRAGAYRYIRHPLYASLLALGWGIFFKAPSLAGVALAAAASVLLYVTARVEEGEMLRKFGDEYALYMRETRMFVPWLL